MLVESCTKLKVFGLQEIGKLLDEFTYGVCQAIRRSTDLSLSNPGNGEVVSEKTSSKCWRLSEPRSST